jgi:mannose-1-phosphate guanylyltransferase
VQHHGIDVLMSPYSTKRMRVLEVPALILAGGLGTRLRPAFDAGPKSMAPVGGRPFVEYLLSQIRRAGCHNVVLCVGHGKGHIEEWVASGARWDLNVRYSVEGEPLGTAGAIKQAASLIDKPDFLVFNGDSFLAIDLKRLVEEHLQSGAWATVALTRVHDPTRFGTVVVGANGQIKEFREKSVQVASESRNSHLVNGGVYVLNKRVLGMIPDSRAVSLEREIFPQLLIKGIRGLLRDGYFIDIGVPEDFERAQAELPEHF